MWAVLHVVHQFDKSLLSTTCSKGSSGVTTLHVSLDWGTLTETVFIHMKSGILMSKFESCPVLLGNFNSTHKQTTDTTSQLELSIYYVCVLKLSWSPVRSQFRHWLKWLIGSQLYRKKDIYVNVTDHLWSKWWYLESQIVFVYQRKGLRATVSVGYVTKHFRCIYPRESGHWQNSRLWMWLVTSCPCSPLRYCIYL